MQLTRRFRQPVMHPKPFPASDYQSPFPEIRQMTGYRGLRQVEGLVQMADADFTACQQVQKPQTHRISERFEKFN